MSDEAENELGPVFEEVPDVLIDPDKLVERYDAYDDDTLLSSARARTATLTDLLSPIGYTNEEIAAMRGSTKGGFDKLAWDVRNEVGSGRRLYFMRVNGPVSIRGEFEVERDDGQTRVTIGEYDLDSVLDSWDLRYVAYRERFRDDADGVTDEQRLLDDVAVDHFHDGAELMAELYHDREFETDEREQAWIDGLADAGFDIDA